MEGNMKWNPKEFLSKYRLQIGMGSVCVVIVAAFLLLFGQKDRMVSVIEYEGIAEVLKHLQQEAVAVFEGMRIEEGDRLTTGEASSVTMLVDEDKVVRLAENSQADFTAITKASGGEATSIHLENGTIINDIKSKLDDNITYEITTPNATVSVRGTYFVVYVGPAEGYEGIVTRVNVYDGVLAVEGAGGEVTILYGDKSHEEWITLESGLEVPSGNRAIVGDKNIYTLSDVDFEGLREKDLDRLAEIVKGGTSAVTLEQIEERRAVLLEMSGTAGEYGDGTGNTEKQSGNGADSGGEGNDDGGRPASEAAETQSGGAKKSEPAAGQESGSPARQETGAKESEKQADAKLPEQQIAEETALPDADALIPGGGQQVIQPDADTGNETASSGSGGGSGGGSGSGGSGNEGAGGGSSGDTGGSGSGDTTPPAPDDNSAQLAQEMAAYAPARLSIDNRTQLETMVADLKGKSAKLGSAIAPTDTAKLAQLAAINQKLAEAEASIASIDNINNVLDAINALPYPCQITAADAAAVNNAAALYNLLPQTEQAQVPARLQSKLTACQGAL